MNRKWMSGMMEVPFPTREALANAEPFRVLVPYWLSLARRRPGTDVEATGNTPAAKPPGTTGQQNSNSSTHSSL